MGGVELKDGKRAKDLKWMLHLNEAMDQCVYVWSCAVKG